VIQEGSLSKMPRMRPAPSCTVNARHVR
jgi:hypothetical protein